MKRHRQWTDEEKSRAADIATGYVNGASRLQQEFECEIEEIDDVLLEMNVERCPGCGWYVDCFDLIPDGEDDPDGFCSNCRTESGG